MGMACSVCADRSTERPKRKFRLNDRLCFDDDEFFELQRFGSTASQPAAIEQRGLNPDHMMLEIKNCDGGKSLCAKDDIKSYKPFTSEGDSWQRKSPSSLIYVTGRGQPVKKDITITETHHGNVRYRNEVEVEPNAISHTREKLLVSCPYSVSRDGYNTS